MREFLVLLGIGDIAAGGHIEIVQLQAILERHAHMPGVTFAAEILGACFFERQPREHGDAVIGLLAVNRLMDIAQLGQGRFGEKLVHHLGLLQAQDVGLLIAQQAGHQLDAVTHRIDVPGGDFQPLHPFHAAIAQQIVTSAI